jgi:hypothetical protein
MNLIKNPKCIYKKIDESGVILEPESGKFIELNSTALEIWNLLDEMNKLEQIKTTLLEKYEEEEALNDDLTEFINSALAANIILKT